MIKFSKENVFLITGASSGIGKAIAIKLNSLGASVVALARRNEVLQEIKNNLSFPENFHIEKIDLAEKVDELAAFAAELAKKYGKFQGMVHSAGVLAIEPFKSHNITDIRNIFDLNFFSGIALARGITSNKIKSEKQSIIFVSSISSISGFSGLTAYSASKSAINGFVRAMAKELGRYKIRVNAILPGTIYTEMVKQKNYIYTDDYLNNIKNKTALGDIGKPEDVANLAAFLLSEASYWITGQCLVIDGGESL